MAGTVIAWDVTIGSDPPPLQKFPAPGVPSPCWNTDKVALVDLIDAAADQPAGGLSSDHWRKFALLGEGGDPLAGTGSAFINENDCTAVERLRAKTFRDYADRIVANSEFECQEN